MATRGKQTKSPTRHPTATDGRRREPILAQIASFVDLFVWLLVLKSFFLPLFIIPTGSEAETLMGAYASHTCPNCGYEYPVGFHELDLGQDHVEIAGPVVQCPNCRYRELSGTNICPGCGSRLEDIRFRDGRPGVACTNDRCPHWLRRGVALDGRTPATPLKRKAGDRIVVHGWPYALGGRWGPQRWDVVVFKVPRDGRTNYIKRLIGLPGETIEIIDGDIFVSDPATGETRIARKTRHAQQALWFPYYDHDYLPQQPARAADYHPRWVALRQDKGWTGLDTRVPRFDRMTRPRAEIQFVTEPGDSTSPGEITDVYGYNLPPPPGLENVVSDVRLSAELTIEGGDGYVELSTTKYSDRFHARLDVDGRVTLEHSPADSDERELWGEASVPAPPRHVRLALANAEYRVSVEIDGKTVIESTSAQYSIEPGKVRGRSRLPLAQRRPVVRIAAERVRATLAHLLIQRDVYYTSRSPRRPNGDGIGTQGHPVRLGSDEYFVCGDNSPASLDSRWWQDEPLGAHLWEAYERNEYQKGTVPADQMIGRAFFVYWPGFMPLVPGVRNCLPDLGRVRWIH